MRARCTIKKGCKKVGARVEGGERVFCDGETGGRTATATHTKGKHLNPYFFVRVRTLLSLSRMNQLLCFPFMTLVCTRSKILAASRFLFDFFFFVPVSVVGHHEKKKKKVSQTLHIASGCSTTSAELTT